MKASHSCFKVTVVAKNYLWLKFSVSLAVFSFAPFLKKSQLSLNLVFF